MKKYFSNTVTIGFICFSLLGMFVLPNNLFAAGALSNSIDQAETVALTGGLFHGDIDDVIRKVIKFILGLASIVAAVAIVYAGFVYISSFGDEKKTETAKHIIFYAIVGLIIMGASAIIVNVVINLL